MSWELNQDLVFCKQICLQLRELISKFGMRIQLSLTFWVLCVPLSKYLVIRSLMWNEFAIALSENCISFHSYWILRCSFVCEKLCAALEYCWSSADWKIILFYFQWIFQTVYVEELQRAFCAFFGEETTVRVSLENNFNSSDFSFIFDCLCWEYISRLYFVGKPGLSLQPKILPKMRKFCEQL